MAHKWPLAIERCIVYISIFMQLHDPSAIDSSCLILQSALFILHYSAVPTACGHPSPHRSSPLTPLSSVTIVYQCHRQNAAFPSLYAQTSLHKLFIPKKFDFCQRPNRSEHLTGESLRQPFFCHHYARLTDPAGQSIRSSRFCPPERARSEHNGQNPPSFVTRIDPKIHVFSIHIAVRPRQNSTISPHKSIFAKS